MNRPRQRTDSSTRRRAFTFLELIVVLMIVGMLAGVAVPRYANMIANRRTEAVV
ncbi:MAG: prepilin-type N-terminal cleavage/methylation domain-containing protein, partial [Planctomycetes bacterium]|nr:prepilin-type N-terminal cleavage/methylation domain-containing protein [Planctomycetota bacterium]